MKLFLFFVFFFLPLEIEEFTLFDHTMKMDVIISVLKGYVRRKANNFLSLSLSYTHIDLIDWLILTAFQPVSGYFMHWGLWITFFFTFLSIFFVLFLQSFFAQLYDIICTRLNGFKNSYLIQIICTQLYDIKYFYEIQIICTQLYDIKYFYEIQIICTQLYDIKYFYEIQIICPQWNESAQLVL